MPANQPEKTIDDLRISVEFGGIPPKQGDVYEFPLTEPAKAALSAMLREIRGEDTHIHDGAAGDEATWEAAQNSLRAEFDQRAAKLGFKL